MFFDYHPAISRHDLSLYVTSDPAAARFKTEIMVVQRADPESPWDVATLSLTATATFSEIIDGLLIAGGG